jgi:CRP-like cAMP-binding protein
MPGGMSAASRTVGNVLLGALPAEERDWLLGRMEAVDLRTRQRLHSAGERIAWLHFPIDCLAGVYGLTGQGATTEYGLIGCEGFTGLSAVFGDSAAIGNAVVVVGGGCYRGAVNVMLDAFHRSASFRRIVTRYASSRVFQLSQTSLCSMHHPVASRLSRWLLQAVDRTGSTTLEITHDLIATALGVRREAVSLAARRLQASGAIHRGRSHIEVASRRRLEAGACECYRILKDDMERLTRETRSGGEPNGSQAR